MLNQSTRTLKLLALAVIAFHFAIVVLHSAAHQVLPVTATPAQLAFIIPVIVLAPMVAGLILLRFNKAGLLLMAVSMLGSFVFGVYYHFIADTIDHVNHVAQMQPPFWSQMFQSTSYLLAISEIFGAALAVFMLLNQSRGLAQTSPEKAARR
jgi:hypothetical protein